MTNLMRYQDLKKYFSPAELLCPHLFDRDGGKGLYYLDPRLVDTLLYIRTTLGKPITVNDYSAGGHLTQRGIRCNCCALVADKTRAGRIYYSSHMQGQGVDFSVAGMSVEDVKRWLRLHAADLPHPIRLESNTTTWIHVDVRTTTGNRIEEFNG